VHVLLPPSETKRPGGAAGTRLDLGALAFAGGLRDVRERAIDAVAALSADIDAAARALGLGPRSREEARHNLVIRESPVMAALDRFDGVLYEGLDAATLPAAARAWAGEHVLVASALLGAVRALDPVPAYRLSASSRVPGLPLGALWRAPLGAALASLPGLVLDLRSQDYRALAPVPGALVLQVVAEDDAGRRRALNHFNKAGKGRFVRALALAGARPENADALLAWAAQEGIQLERGAPGELVLVV